MDSQNNVNFVTQYLPMNLTRLVLSIVAMIILKNELIGFFAFLIHFIFAFIWLILPLFNMIKTNEQVYKTAPIPMYIDLFCVLIMIYYTGCYLSIVVIFLVALTVLHSIIQKAITGKLALISGIIGYIILNIIVSLNIVNPINILTLTKTTPNIIASILSVIIFAPIDIVVFVVIKGIINKNDKLINSLDASDKENTRLLNNILPEYVIKDIKLYGKSKARTFNNVVIGFSDFQDFTLKTKKLTPEKIIGILNIYFSEFDLICNKYHLERIKTIGDGFMFTTKLTDDNKVTPMLEASFEMIDYCNKNIVDIIGNEIWPIRIGMSIGTVVAGVVGSNKFAFDVWGDCVNMAARLEQGGIPGQINVSAEIIENMPSTYYFLEREALNIKNTKNLKQFIVNKHRTTAST